jgi:hypothetical protein
MFKSKAPEKDQSAAANLEGVVARAVQRNTRSLSTLQGVRRQLDFGGRFDTEASPRLSSSRTAAAWDGIRAPYLKSSMAAISSERR